MSKSLDELMAEWAPEREANCPRRSPPQHPGRP